jgi:hypothetical protein
MRVCHIVARCSLLLLLLLLVASPASAFQYLGTTLFTCQDFDADDGDVILDRDNTGIGEERFRIDVTDGGGAVIFTDIFQNTLGIYASGITSGLPYTSPPQSNHITMTVTSLAGNGLPQVVGYASSGICGRLAARLRAISATIIEASALKRV